MSCTIGGAVDVSGFACCDAFSLYRLVFLVCLTLGARSTAGASSLELRLSNSHHLLGDAVCFLLVHVPWRVDRQLRLYRSGWRMDRNTAKIVPKDFP